MTAKIFTGKLIIFVKNPVKGKVKTRLAEDIGEDNALKVYLILIQHTLEVAAASGLEVHVFFSDTLDNKIPGFQPTFKAHLQKGEFLGDKIFNAFAVIHTDDTPVLIIGSDCYQLTANHLHEAIKVLDIKDAVLGTTFDGGYYLLGLKKLNPRIFENIPWSTSRVAQKTLAHFVELEWDYLLLPPLYDVDDKASMINSHLTLD